MNCTYCGTRNSDEDHRCRRCGRRLGARPMPVPAGAPATRGSSAPRLDQRQAIPAEVAEASLNPAQRPPRQKSLFPQSVLQFEEYAPSGRTPRASRPAREGARRVVRRRSRKLERLEEAGQQRLNLESGLPMARPKTDTGVTPAKGCVHEVAPPARRLLSALIDGAILAAAGAIVFAIFYGIAGAAALAHLQAAVYAGAAAGVFVLFKALWWVAGRDTPGMACCGLRLLSFSGRRPTGAQRLQHLAGNCLSIAACGLGLLWALGDEEKLCWSDHLSKTFPSPRAATR